MTRETTLHVAFLQKDFVVCPGDLIKIEGHECSGEELLHLIELTAGELSDICTEILYWRSLSLSLQQLYFL
jgi:hypothetical protein